MPLLTLSLLIIAPGTPSHLHRLTQMEGLKLQQYRLQISLYSPHMPDRGGERITGFTVSGQPFMLPRPMAQPHQQIIITAHKGMEERGECRGRKTKIRGRERKRERDVILQWVEGGRIETSRKNDAEQKWESENENRFNVWMANQEILEHWKVMIVLEV